MSMQLNQALSVSSARIALKVDVTLDWETNSSEY